MLERFLEDDEATRAVYALPGGWRGVEGTEVVLVGSGGGSLFASRIGGVVVGEFGGGGVGGGLRRVPEMGILFL